MYTDELVVQRYQSKKRIVLTQDMELGRGGEGVVYKVPGEPHLVAKVYHPYMLELPAYSNRGQKLRSMVNNPPINPTADLGHVAIAWPVDLLTTDDSEEIIGFLMPRIDDAHEFVEIYNAALIARMPSRPNIRFRYYTARNLAMIVNSMHENLFVIGDINEGNALVTDDALVTLIDTDSFHVRDRDGDEVKVFRCFVGKGEYTPPELIGRRFEDIDSETPRDLFAMGVLIFQLLMGGDSPI